ncbi:signal peptide peptidase SppA [Agaribacterium sp. ZY112]|uniref:signal peptide peptidase SppA n=1 Tax=Agaribacterium sp. ZY112 TaxID=3233574 RepID=UPI0035254863
MALIKTLFHIVATMLRWIRSIALGLVSLAILFIVIESFSSAPEIQIPNNSALFIAPSGALVDQSSYEPNLMDVLGGAPEQAPETVLGDLIKAIKLAKNDAQITSLVLRLDWLQSAGMSKVEELGHAIEQFKSSGKPVIAYANNLSQQRYLLASYADEIYIHPMGGIHLNGFGIYRNYFKQAADNIKLQFHVFRSGKYKDAVEPFMRNDMSEESREHLSTWINQSWQRYTHIIEQQRDLPSGRLNQLAQELDLHMEHYRGDAALFAMENGLVDAVYSRVQLLEKLKEKVGEKDNGEPNAIDVQAYLNNPALPSPAKSEKQIGLIIASGNIVEGHQHGGAIGSESLNELITQAREDDNVSALVLRVDSGGGSAFASEIIREQLQLTRDSGKPVYISMGSIAASGGYWISTAAEEIWATPSTITGSIGVFGLIPNVSASLNSLGIHSDGVGTTPFSGSWNLDRTMSEQTKSLIQSSVDNIYHQFINLVAEARQQTPEQINEIAQGHIWSGQQAKELGLVDELGGLDELLSSVAKRMELKGDAVKLIQRQLSPKEQLIQALMEQASSLPFDVLSTDLQQSLDLARSFSAPLTQLHPVLSPTLKNNNAMDVWAQCLVCAAP